jgi:hypothetical protein
MGVKGKGEKRGKTTFTGEKEPKKYLQKTQNGGNDGKNGASVVKYLCIHVSVLGGRKKYFQRWKGKSFYDQKIDPREIGGKIYYT